MASPLRMPVRLIIYVTSWRNTVLFTVPPSASSTVIMNSMLRLNCSWTSQDLYLPPLWSQHTIFGQSRAVLVPSYSTSSHGHSNIFSCFAASYWICMSTVQRASWHRNTVYCSMSTTIWLGQHLWFSRAFTTLSTRESQAHLHCNFRDLKGKSTYSV